MEKVQAKDVVEKNVLDYVQACKYIDHVLGYKQRDAAAKFENGSHPERPYQDFWHYMIDVFPCAGNDTYVRYPQSFITIYEDTKERFGEDDWRTKIAKVWADEYPDTYQIWFSW